MERLGPLLEKASGTEGSGQGPDAHLGDKECKVQQMRQFSKRTAGFVGDRMGIREK